MKQLADSKGLKVAVILVPTKEEVYSWVLDERQPWSTSNAPSAFSVVFRDLSEREGMPFVDLKPFLIDASRRAFEDAGELIWWRDDTHWNVRGNREVASIVYEKVLGSRGSLAPEGMSADQ